jgi:hypothetical protein
MKNAKKEYKICVYAKKSVPLQAENGRCESV